jgi:hypothetical protein
MGRSRLREHIFGPVEESDCEIVLIGLHTIGYDDCQVIEYFIGWRYLNLQACFIPFSTLV